MLNSFEELCIMRAAAEKFFAKALNAHREVYIYTERLFHCITTIQSGKTLDLVSDN